MTIVSRENVSREKVIRTQDAHNILAFAYLLSNGFVSFLQCFLLLLEYFNRSVIKYINDISQFMEILPRQIIHDNSPELRRSNFQRLGQEIGPTERHLG